MKDPRPVVNIIGVLVMALGAAMLVPMALDFVEGAAHWKVFLESAIVTFVAGGMLTLATANSVGAGLSVQQVFMLTSGVWAVLPFFGAIPFFLGAPHASFTDAYFEAMSGLTTTGTTVFVGLDDMPAGTLLWRGILQWLGGLGIVIVAMVFLPLMRVGGMQFFQTEGFDTLGKVLPRAIDISSALIRVYVLLTVLCATAYLGLGMTGLEATVHALTTMSTGGFSTSDKSFGLFQGPAEYVAALFMFLASLPFVRFIQLLSGDARPLWRDVQVRAYLRWTAYAVAAIVIYRMAVFATPFEPALRETVFNVVSLFSGTGYGSEDITAWGPFPFTVIIIIGLVGGCTSSTACSVKVFRYLVLFEAIRAQIRRLYSPNRVVNMRLGRQPLAEDVVNSVLVFFTLFMLSFAGLTVLLDLAGLSTETALTASWTAIANIGPAFGPGVGPTGAVDAFPAAAKWLMVGGMYVGRLELLAVLVLFLPKFWRA
ncbi:MAG: TrkH family potassium uptake protein [Alphaproteobacteria bacterium]|nr:MAG: TrkH family potassium uptake protein [Alphaproteobacteria bacterium]